jgi:putative transposase
MAQYKINVNEEVLHGLFHQDEGLTRLLTRVVNQVLEAK